MYAYGSTHSLTHSLIHSLIPSTAPGDYAPANNQRFTIPAVMTRSTINIPIVNDDNNEPTERFQAQIALVPSVTPSGVTIGTPNPTNIDITDNDSESVYTVWEWTITVCFTDIVASFERTPYTVDESVGNAVVTVVLNRPSPNPLMLQYSTVVTEGGATGIVELLVYSLTHSFFVGHSSGRFHSCH